jgi:hypothetical protein
VYFVPLLQRESVVERAWYLEAPFGGRGDVVLLVSSQNKIKGFWV